MIPSTAVRADGVIYQKSIMIINKSLDINLNLYNKHAYYLYNFNNVAPTVQKLCSIHKNHLYIRNFDFSSHQF